MAPPVELVGLELADVVKERAGHGDVAIDPGEGGGDRAHGLGHGEAMLEQAVPVGLVVALGRRRIPVARPGGRALAEDRGQQPAQVRVLDRPQELTQVGLHLSRGPSWAVHQLSVGELLITRAAECLNGQLGTEAGMHGVAAGDEHDRPGAAELTHLSHAVPDDGGHAARAVTQGELQILAAVAA